MAFIKEIPVDITQYLVGKRDTSIRNILNLLDISDISTEHRSKIRKVVLEELNGAYDAAIRVLTYVQEE